MCAGERRPCTCARRAAGYNYCNYWLGEVNETSREAFNAKWTPSGTVAARSYSPHSDNSAQTIA